MPTNIDIQTLMPTNIDIQTFKGIKHGVFMLYYTVRNGIAEVYGEL